MGPECWWGICLADLAAWLAQLKMGLVGLGRTINADQPERRVCGGHSKDYCLLAWHKYAHALKSCFCAMKLARKQAWGPKGSESSQKVGGCVTPNIIHKNRWVGEHSHNWCRHSQHAALPNAADAEAETGQWQECSNTAACFYRHVAP